MSCHCHLTPYSYSIPEGGILVAPVQEGSLQILTRFYKIGGKITSEAIEQCLFVPVLEGTQR